jgi:hypothetical protein
VIGSPANILVKSIDDSLELPPVAVWYSLG